MFTGRKPILDASHLVRSTNDLYKPYGIGRVQKVRNGMAKIEFNPPVFMEPPYRSERCTAFVSAR